MKSNESPPVRRADSIDVYEAETNLLGELFSVWDKTAEDRSSPGEVVVDQWDHGTIGKVILEHAAIQLAATEDIVRVLRHNEHPASLFEPEAAVVAQREVMDRMFDAGRGVYSIDLARSVDFIVATDDLKRILGPQLRARGVEQNVHRAKTTLGNKRSLLRSAAFIARHSPTRPGSRSGYDRFSFMARMHAVIDRMQGGPWGHSSFGDKALSAKYEPLPYRDLYIQPSDEAS